MLELADYYYYKFFSTHFDDVVFGIVNDDTTAVLLSVWTDYPVIKILLGLIISFIAIRWYFTKIMSIEFKFPVNNLVAKIAFAIVLWGLFAIGMRGSLGTFPIGKDNMVVCNNNTINDITPNGIFYLKETIADKSKFKIDTTTSSILAKYKYNSPIQAIDQYLPGSHSGKDIMSLLESTTDTNTFLEQNPPNVVVFLMESFGNHYLELHSPTLNLLGELENQLPYCYVNRNFLSSCNGTIPSLESLIVNSPSCPLSQSAYKRIPIKSSSALPYKNAGYKTLYITGGDLAWRNTGKYFNQQYFDEIEGRNEILTGVEGASDCTWGVFDQYLFDHIFDKLCQNSKNDQTSFIFALTTSNHTPFERPNEYSGHPVKLTPEISNSIKTTEEIAIENFTSYQYSNNYLGEFIKKIRGSELGRNTIIAIAGDHNNRQLFEYSDDMAFYHYSVPFVLYVPEAYKENKAFDTSRFGSHKDIFPTLYNLSLSGAKYLNSGNDLLTTDTTTYFYGVNGYNMGIDDRGATFFSSGLCYNWVNNTRKLEASNDKSKFKTLNNSVRSHSFLMDYYVRNAIKASLNSTKK